MDWEGPMGGCQVVSVFGERSWSDGGAVCWAYPSWWERK